MAKRRIPACGACGRRTRSMTPAIVLEGKGGRVATRVCRKCARTGVLVVCGAPHLAMVPRAVKKRKEPRGLLRSELGRLETAEEKEGN